MRVAEIRDYLLQALPVVEVVGSDDIEIQNVGKIENAKAGEIAFVANPKYEKYLSETNASAVIISNKLNHGQPKANQAFIKVEDAYAGFAFILERFAPKREELDEGIHPTAVTLSPVPETSRVGANAYIGKNCRIGERAKIYPNVVIMDDCVIGDDCAIFPNATIYGGTKIGNRVTIHAGAVIGADGFGFAPQKDGSYRKIPQIGAVIIEDDVEIGANTCIDRATMGETRIAEGVKIDNLVQIAHNCSVGKHTVIAAQAGVSGSTKIGAKCLIGGQAGFVGHIEIGDGITIGAQSGVTKSYFKKGEFIRGYPARPLREQLRQEAYQAKLGELFEQVRRMEKELSELKNRLQTQAS